MHSEIGLRVRAPAAEVFELARDVGRWADRLPHYRRVTVRATRGDRVLAQMVAERRFGRLAVPVTWRAICWPDPSDPDDLRLRFRHVRIVFLRLGVPRHSRNATIYLPDPRLAVSRISEPKNRSAAMAPAHETGLVAEVRAGAYRLLV